MKKFMLIYFGTLSLLFILFYLPTNPLAEVLNGTQTDITLSLLRPFLDHDQLQGHEVWINPHYKIVINNACNGLIPLFLLWAAIVAFPSKTLKKILWITIGYFIFIGVNTLRIVAVIYMSEKYGGESFFLAHDLFGNAILLLTGAMILISYLRTAYQRT
jgi:exosortase/archaeosortase family protein